MTYAVRFEEVSKRYVRGGARYASLRSEVTSAARRALSRMGGAALEPRGKLALDRISFEVAEGQSYALVGPNGAGKSTALKLLSRISYPTGGRLAVRGRVAALIEVGSGVHPELTGRENIWLYGRIFGMSKAQIRRQFDAIVSFADLPGSLDVPVKMYSSGMQLRLGFAIASHLDPDVFVVDEALAVGDAAFQTKCVERMTKLVAEGRTLVFVSHNLNAVEALCDRALFLLEGRVEAEGPTREIVRQYLDWTEQQRGRLIAQQDPNAVLRVRSATCHRLDGQECYEFARGEGLEIRIVFENDDALTKPHVVVGINHGGPYPLVECSMLVDGQAPERVGKTWECRLRIETLPLRPRQYQVWCDAFGATGSGSLMWWTQVSNFRVQGDVGQGPVAVSKAASLGPVDVPYSWQVSDDWAPQASRG